MVRELGYVGSWESTLFEYTNAELLPSFYTWREGPTEATSV